MALLQREVAEPDAQQEEVVVVAAAEPDAQQEVAAVAAVEPDAQALGDWGKAAAEPHQIPCSQFLHLVVLKSESGVRSESKLGLTGPRFSILQHSAGISALQPAEAELVAAEAAPDGPSGVLAAAAVALPFVEAVAGPFGEVEALASPFAEPDAAAVQYGVVAQLVEFEAVFQASVRPAE